MIKPQMISADSILPKDIGNWKNKMATGATENDKKKAAKSFESILLVRLLEQMNKTVVKWDGEDDPAAGQIQSLFGMLMANHLSEAGGIGLWKQVYKDMAGQMNQQNMESQQGQNSEISSMDSVI